MRYVLYGVTGVYALLSMLAAAVQMKTVKKKDMSVLMLLGGALWIAAIVTGWLQWQGDWIVGGSGGILMMVAAWTNGTRSGQLHYSHHAVRLAITVLLTAGFAAL